MPRQSTTVFLATAVILIIGAALFYPWKKPRAYLDPGSVVATVGEPRLPPKSPPLARVNTFCFNCDKTYPTATGLPFASDCNAFVKPLPRYSDYLPPIGFACCADANLVVHVVPPSMGTVERVAVCCGKEFESATRRTDGSVVCLRRGQT